MDVYVLDSDLCIGITYTVELPYNRCTGSAEIVIYVEVSSIQRLSDTVMWDENKWWEQVMRTSDENKWWEQVSLNREMSLIQSALNREVSFIQCSS